MQHLDIISVNIWQMLISLCNLLILFLLLKKFLYRPVKKMLAQRQAAVDEQYAAAERERQAAETEKAAYEEKNRLAQQQAEAVLSAAEERAQRQSQQIVAQAQEKADILLHQAQTEAELERKKATAGIRQEIVDVSALLAEKMLSREINADDHREMIDAFLKDVE